MKRMLISCCLAMICLNGTAQAAKEILLRTSPEAEAAVIAKVTASEKVILDAAPAPRNADAGWRQLALPTPFEGYVPTATINKSFEIVEGTPVRYLPTANAARITVVEEGDVYEVVRAKDDWATVRFRKDITGYFIDDATEEVAIDFESLQVPVVNTEPVTAPVTIPVPAPVTIPAPRARVSPDEPISQLDPNSLPPENVVWKPTTKNEPAPHISDPTSQIPDPESRIPDPVMVSPAQTQAREAAPDLGPAKTPRLLTGILKRQFDADGTTYPIRLQSPEGRLIAYVDFSGIYVSDLSPYLDQKVYIRGQIHPLPESNSRLVILAESLRLAE